MAYPVVPPKHNPIVTTINPTTIGLRPSVNSFEPIDIAYALEGMEGTSVDGGKIYMRKEDHQIHFDMQALLLTEKNDQSVIYRNQDFDMSYVTVGNIPMEDITLDTSCEMKRP